jgi:DNA-binding transcriptional ArsR family regulator
MDIAELTLEQVERAATMLKAIAHPVRIKIINSLGKDNEMSVTQIHEALDIEQSSASHHLGILRDKGILNSRRDGKNIYYYLRNDNLTKIVECIGSCACDD